MRNKRRSWKERICALALAVMMVLSGIMPGVPAETAEAANGDKVSVEFKLSNDVTDATIKIKDNASTEEPQEISKNEDNKYIIELEEGKVYTYTVTKAGYDTVTKDNFKVTASETTEPTEPVAEEITMNLSSIAVNEEVSGLTVDGSKTISVTNKVDGATYTCTSDNEAVSVSGDLNTGWTLTAIKGGTAQITVENDKGSEPKVFTVTVNKKQIAETLTINVTSEPVTGINVTNVTCSLSGLPNDATGKVSFTLNGNNTKTVPVGDAAVFEGAFAGHVAITASYLGDERYEAKDAIATGAEYLKEKELVLVNGEEEKNLTFGEEEWNKVFTVPIDTDNCLDGRTLSYESSDPKVATVDAATGEITPLHAGTTIITVTATGENYKVATLEYPVKISQKEIGSLNDFTWEGKIERCYNGKSDIQIKGTLKENQNYQFVLDVKLDNANSGEDKQYTIDNSKSYEIADEKGFKDYLLKKDFTENNKENIGTEINILKRPVYVKINNINSVSLEYGRDKTALDQEVRNKTELVILSGKNGEIDDNSGYLNNDEEAALPVAKIRDEFSTTEFYVEDTENGKEVIIPDITTGDATENYKYEFLDEPENCGSLILTRQKLSDADILKYIDVTSLGNGYDVRYDEQGNLSEIWVSSKVNLKLGIKNEYAAFYDTVMFKYDDTSSEINATKDGITFENYSEPTQKIQLSNAKIWLANSKNSNTYTESINGGENSFSIVNVDNQSPTVDFGELKIAGVAESALNAITFGLFKTNTYQMTLGISDGVGSGISDSVGRQYYVWKMDKEITDNDLTAAEVNKKIKDLNDNGDWSELKNNTIFVGSGTTKEAVEGRYAIFVKTTDKVGNTDVYVSNGMVIEQNTPSIMVEMEQKEYYAGDVEYKLIVDDAVDDIYTSGIKQIEVTVSNKGVITNGPENNGENGIYEDSYTIDLTEDLTQDSTDTSKKIGYSIEELKNKSIKTINGRITAAKNNSNDVKIEVKALDNAGNKKSEEEEGVKWSKEIKIDATVPEITVSYDKKDTDAKNAIYFQERIMTVQYKERNIEKDPVKTGITFDVVKDGVTYNDTTLSGLKALGIEWIDDKIEDTQLGTNINDLSDERLCTIRLRFATDGDYTIIPKCTDLAGHTTVFSSTTETDTHFIIDDTDPVINVVYKDIEGNIAKEYNQSSVTGIITIDEKNFWISEKTFSETTEQWDFTATKEEQVAVKEPMDADAYRKMAIENSGYVVNKGTTTLTFAPDANYTVGFTYTDLAGNTAVYTGNRFTVDKTAPTGEIQIRDTIWSKLLEALSFGFFNNDSEVVTMRNADHTAGVASMQYYKYIPDVEARGDFKGLTLSELEKITEWKSGNIEADTTLTINQEEQVFVYTKIVDRAGNVTYMNADQGVIIDKTAPTGPEITITTPDPAQGIFNRNVDFTMHITDPESGKTYAGLKEVYYEVRKDGVVTQSGNYNAELTDQKARRHSMTKSEVVDAKLNNSNDVTIWVKAVDYAGNVSEKTKDIKIDITAPTIQVTYDLNNPSNGKYYNATRTATVTVTERNFDENAVRFNITNTDGTQPAISGWSRSANAGVSDSAVNTCTVTFAADGDYTFTLNTTDLAGNESNYTQVDEFTIDKTVPTINVAFDNNSASNGRYYNAPRTATITVNEHNFNGSEVQTAISAALQSQGISAPGVNGWSTSGDVHTATVHFGTDGDYSFTVNYTDLAGNAATAHTVDTFTIDQTKPEIEIFDIEDKSANNGTVAPGVRYSDVNYNENDVTLTIKGPKHSATTVDGSRSSIPNGQSIKMADFAHEESVDDVYTLTAQVTDMAGNSHEESVTFSVNRFGSNYIFSDSTKSFLDKYYSNSEESLVVTEINVDTLEHYGISYGRDGELEKLEKGKDYTVKESGNEVSWKHYQYTIKASNFEKEGLYNVTIDSRDRAKNEVNNKVKNADIEFVIDKTAPTVVITGVEDDTQYRANNRDISIAVADNVAIGGMDVFVDDSEKPVDSYDAQAILNQKGEVPFTLNSSNDWQKLKAVATDAAGNTAETSEYRVLITSNILVQFVRNTPLVIGSSVSLLAVAGVIILLIAKKKKKEEEA